MADVICEQPLTTNLWQLHCCGAESIDDWKSVGWVENCRFKVIMMRLMVIALEIIMIGMVSLRLIG